jgi:hypothetical protein
MKKLSSSGIFFVLFMISTGLQDLKAQGNGGYICYNDANGNHYNNEVAVLCQILRVLIKNGLSNEAVAFSVKKPNPFDQDALQQTMSNFCIAGGYKQVVIQEIAGVDQVAVMCRKEIPQ